MTLLRHLEVMNIINFFIFLAFHALNSTLDKTREEKKTYSAVEKTHDYKASINSGQGINFAQYLLAWPHGKEEPGLQIGVLSIPISYRLTHVRHASTNSIIIACN